MATHTPDSQIEKFEYNPVTDVPRTIFNSGYPITEGKMNTAQKTIQNELLNNFRSLIKYPGIVRVN